MADNYFDLVDEVCSSEVAFNFSVGKQVRVGHVTALTFTISSKSLKADTEVKDPTNPDSAVQAVASVDCIRWDGNPTHAIHMIGRLSPENKGLMKDALASSNGGADVSVKFDIYEYDFTAKKYFKMFTTDGADLKCIITENTKVRVGSDLALDVTQPPNFTFDIQLTGKGEKQKLIFSASASSKINRDFGTKVG